jgi:2-polyprenyl-3-methyl-5-hydroxy-6-metoxy-1,4-benzoquinol methylase
LEIGAGHGIIYTTFLGEDAESVMATDLDLKSLDLVRQRNDDSRISTRQLDLNAPTMFETLTNQFDTVICLNVLEHIACD